MADPAQWFAEGGSTMAVILLLNVVGLLALMVSWLMALVARFRGRTGFLTKTVPALVMMGAFLPVLVGAFGYLSGRSAAVAAVSHAPASERAALLEAGLDLAVIPLHFGGISTVLLGSVAVLALMIAPWSSRAD